MDTGLRGKTILITGAAGGIGQATARAFAEEGAQLILHYNTGLARAERLVEELGKPHVILQADLRDEGQVERLFSESLAEFPQLDCLVANAGIWAEAEVPVHEMSLEQWRHTMEGNLTSTFLTCRAFLRHLSDRPRESASIVLVASTAGVFGEAGHADYSAAKSAMAYGLTLSLKNEIIRLVPRGRVNCVCPGWTDTPMAAGAMGDQEAVVRAWSTMAIQRVAQPEDIAHAILYLASDRISGHVSGQRVTVAGGMEGRRLH